MKQTPLLLLPLALTTALAATAKDYENFDLPKKKSAVVSESGLSYVTPRVTLKGKNARLKEPSVDAKEFLFAKEAFLAERRDQAIKLLRQEMDSGMSANRDNMLLRLGQLYAEKYMELSYRENELYSQQLAEYEKRKATDKSAKTPANDNSRSQSYLKDSLELFYGLEREYPKHPKMDEVLFFIGFVEMERGNTKGLQYLDRVMRHYPKSKKFEEAVIYIADHYFEKARFRDAYARYRILTARRESPIYPFAKYKIAWCELNTGEQRKGVATMKSLIEELADTKDKAKFNLREQALKDMVIFFAETESVDEAISYFTEKVGRDRMLENLRLMADMLRSKARDQAAIKAYSRLIDEYPNHHEAPLMALGIHDSYMRLGRTEAAVETLEKALSRYGATSDWAKDYPKEKAAELKNTLNSLQTESEKAALLMHQSAQKSKNKGAYAYALRLYTALLNAFPNHPSRKNISFYKGEILYERGRWLEAANSYMDAAKTPPKDKRTDESVYAALQALDQLSAKQGKLTRYTKEEQGKVSQEKQEIPEGERRFIEVADFYLKEYPQGERVVDVRFRVAAIYYRYHHFDEAQAKFKEIALRHPKHRSASTAAHIVLDIYNIKKDYDSLAKTAGEFISTEGLGDAEFRKEMAQIVTEVGFKRIEKLEADGKWKEAGDAYMAVYKANPNGSLAERALYNAYVSYEKSNDIARTIEASRLFVSRFPKSQYTQRMVLGQAKTAERQYDFDEAQRLYHDFYKKFPKDKEARKALFNAAVFAELLERNKEATQLFNEYLRGPSTPEERKAIQISLAKLYRKEGRFDLMATAYRRLARDARSFDEKMSFLAELARQYELAGRSGEKDQVIKEMRWQYNSTPGAKPTGQAAFYLAEAEFRTLVPKRDKYTEIKLRFPPEDLVYLMKRKEKALVKLAEAYDKIVEIGVPDWGVAALYEKSSAYDDYVRSFRAVQIPAKYQGEVRAEAEKSLKAIDEKLVKPLELKAAEISKACADRAAQFHVANEFASKCRDRMKKPENYTEPAGQMPQPAYWSTRPPSAEVVKK